MACSFSPDRTPDKGVLMKRFALFLVALSLSIPVAGCGGDSGGGSGSKVVSRVDDPNLPSEVREYEAKSAQRLAERAEKASHAKSAKSASKTR
jgi:hypothetical protein